jgi:Transglutaminase-like superfamily
MPPPSRWLAHTPMTETATLAALFTRLPRDIAGLNRVAQGLLVHGDLLGKYGDDPAAFGPVSRTTLPVRQRLEALLERDGRPLDEVRVPTQRGVGTCRDFALIVCAFLRTMGTPARPRCGFASYFAEAWEDHWVCEYWNSREGRWCLTDAQLDAVQKASFQVVFDTSDVPRDVFLTAGEAWLRCRAGVEQPERFGQGATRGLWFMKMNVVRDALAVDNRETSSWDRWREAPIELRTVPPDELTAVDSLAHNPEQVVELTPSWLDRAA